MSVQNCWGMKRYFVLAIIAILFFAGCSQYKEIDISSMKIERVRMSSVKEVDLQLSVMVNNPSGKELVLSSVEGKLLRNGVSFADVELLEEAVVPARSNGEVEVKCRLVFADPMAALALGLNFASLNKDDFTADMEAVVRSGALKKKFRYNGMTIARLLKQFGVKL